MKPPFKICIAAGLGLGLVLAATLAHAQTAGDWLFKLGYNQITPQVKSGDLSPPSLPGTKIDIGSAGAPIVSATYMVSETFSIEGYAGLSYKHDVKGDGTIAGVGTIGTIKQVSPTVFAQYRFLTSQYALRPYVGLGLTYAYFYGGTGSAVLTALTNPGGPPTTLKADSGFGLSPQLGLNFKLNDRWFLDASVIKTYIKTKSTLSTGQSINLQLDPVAANVSVGYRF